MSDGFESGAAGWTAPHHDATRQTAAMWRHLHPVLPVPLPGGPRHRPRRLHAGRLHSWSAACRPVAAAEPRRAIFEGLAVSAAAARGSLVSVHTESLTEPRPCRVAALLHGGTRTGARTLRHGLLSGACR